VRILVTNDDGIDSIGLHVLARAMTRHGHVVVAAPDREYSGAGAALGALHLLQPEVHRVALDGVPEAWSVTGPPGLCVMFSRLGAFGEPFDLIVSGINPGANVGRSIYHSGTVGACLTGRNGGISGLAVSQAVDGFGVEGQGWDEMLVGQCWDTAAAVADAFVEGFLTAPPPRPVVANVNVPNLPLEQVRGWRFTEVGTAPPRAMASAGLEPIEGHEQAYRVTMSWGDALALPEGTDGGTVERDEVSVTYLSRLVAEPTELPAVERSLDGLVGRGR
jgi:5'-nucleotidase